MQHQGPFQETLMESQGFLKRGLMEPELTGHLRAHSAYT